MKRRRAPKPAPVPAPAPESDSEEGASDASASPAELAGAAWSSGDESPAGGSPSESDSDGAGGPTGLGAAIGNILAQPVGDGAAPVLAKRKTSQLRELEAEALARKQARVTARERRERLERFNKPPEVATLNYERQLKRVATQGVVALFNAVYKQQRREAQGEEADRPAEAAVKSMSRENFLKLIKSGEAGSGAAGAAAAAAASAGAGAASPAAEPARWAALQDSYLMGAGIKDWDKEGAAAAAAGSEQSGSDLEQSASDSD